MGIYLNPDNAIFRRDICADIYVDKTLMINETNRFIDTGNNYICISRPRRFGKTITGNMLAAYYSRGCDSEKLFSGLQIAGVPGFRDKLNQYNVIQIDMNSEYQNSEDTENLISRLRKKIKKEMVREFPAVEFDEEDSLADYMLNIYSQTKQTFVILLDEYDVLVREQVSEKLFNEYLSFLNGLFKSNTLRPAISLAYLTGILPVVRDKIQSKLNNFEEYTILDSEGITPFLGFTADEVRTLCSDYGVDFEECRLWYDGYHQNGYELYNPESVVKAVRKKKFDSFWGKTSTYEAITDRIRRNYAGTKDDVIRMLSGENVSVNVTRYMNTMTSFHTKDDVFTYLIHLGYLAYDRDDSSSCGTCRIPNREVRQEWFNAIETESEYAITTQIIRSSRELLKETWMRNGDAVAQALDRSHIHVTSNRSYNNEDALQSAIYLAYIYALNRYTVIKEMTTGKGFADVVFIPIKDEDPAMIIELKRNDCTESALNQIKDRQYYDSLSHYQGKLLFVGINYDEKGKTHTCNIEAFEKN